MHGFKRVIIMTLAALALTQCNRQKHAKATDATAEKPTAVVQSPLQPISPAKPKRAPSSLDNSQAGDVLTIIIGPEVEIDFAWCPPGTFHASKGGEVTLSEGFFIAKTEVTQKQWEAVMKDNPSHFTGENMPVNSISWDDAQAFISKINNPSDGPPRLPDHWKMVLPTECQWEYAARAGNKQTADYYDKIIEETCWYGKNSGLMPHPVASKQPNAWGLYDTLGNVIEWCEDGYADTRPIGLDPFYKFGDKKVQRGGCYSEDKSHCKPGYRYNKQIQTSHGWNQGFRPAIVRKD